MNTVLDNIGNTPLVRLNRIPGAEGLKCEVCKYIHYLAKGGPKL